MFIKQILLLVNCLLLVVYGQGQQSFAKWDEKQIELNNGIVQRVIQLPDSSGRYMTTLYKPVAGDFNYFKMKTRISSLKLTEKFTQVLISGKF